MMSTERRHIRLRRPMRLARSPSTGFRNTDVHFCQDSAARQCPWPNHTSAAPVLTTQGCLKPTARHGLWRQRRRLLRSALLGAWVLQLRVAQGVGGGRRKIGSTVLS